MDALSSLEHLMAHDSLGPRAQTCDDLASSESEPSLLEALSVAELEPAEAKGSTIPNPLDLVLQLDHLRHAVFLLEMVGHQDHGIVVHDLFEDPD